MPRSARGPGRARRTEPVLSFDAILADALGSPAPALDIVTFATTILKAKLFPRQRTILRLIFCDTEHMTDYDRMVIDQWRQSFTVGGGRVLGVPPDVWERIAWCQANGYEHFREVLLLLGRRGGKNFLAAICGAYLIYQLLLMGWPQERIGIDPDKDLVLFASATTRSQGKDNSLRDIARVLRRADWFKPYVASISTEEIVLRSPHDLARLAELEGEGVPFQEPGSIRVRAISTNAPGARGPAAFGLHLDEFAHVPVTPSGVRSGDAGLTAVVPALDQVKRLALILITTSPYTRTGACYERYEQALETDPETGAALNPDTLVVQLTSFDPYRGWDDLEATGGVVMKEPPEVDDEFMDRERRRNPEKFSVERESQWASVQQAYLNPGVIARAYCPYCTRCGHSFPAEEWTAASGYCPWCRAAASPSVPSFRDHTVGLYLYFGHADPAEGFDSFAACVGHLVPFTEPDGLQVGHVVIDYLAVWDPAAYPNATLPFAEIQDELAGVLTRFRGVTRFSYDQYGSIGTIQGMKDRLLRANIQTRVIKLPHSEANNKLRSEITKEAMACNLVHIPVDAFGPNGRCRLAAEMEFLQLRNGKVIKPTTGPVRTDDLWTAYSVVVWQLLTKQYGRALRDMLAKTPVFAALQGGYQSGMISYAGTAPTMSEARRRLKATMNGPSGPNVPPWGRNRPGEIPWGLFDPARRKYL